MKRLLLTLLGAAVLSATVMAQTVPSAPKEQQAAPKAENISKPEGPEKAHKKHHKGDKHHKHDKKEHHHKHH